MHDSRLQPLTPRLGERRAMPFRAGRLFAANGAWYFQTREGQPQGPYRDRDMAENAIGRYVHLSSFPTPLAS